MCIGSIVQGTQQIDRNQPIDHSSQVTYSTRKHNLETKSMSKFLRENLKILIIFLTKKNVAEIRKIIKDFEVRF